MTDITIHLEMIRDTLEFLTREVRRWHDDLSRMEDKLDRMGNALAVLIAVDEGEQEREARQ